MKPNPIKALMWFIRGGAILMMVVGSIMQGSVASEFVAIPALAFVMSFFIERQMMERFGAVIEANERAEQFTPPATAGTQSMPTRLGLIWLRVVMTGMRIIGGLFVVVGGIMLIAFVAQIFAPHRPAGEFRTDLAGIVMLVGFISFGVFLVLGRAEPVLRSLHQFGEAVRRR